MIVDQARYRDGVRLPCEDISTELEALREDRWAEGEGVAQSDFLWVGLKNPSTETFARVTGDELDLHALAIEDAVQGEQRPKLERYEGSYFSVLRPLRYVEDTSDIETGELMVFVGEDFILTIRKGEASPLGDLRSKLEQTEPDSLRHGPWGVFHAILDHIVDQYLTIEDQVQEDLDDIETGIFSNDGNVTSEQIYRLKREVLEFKRAALPLQRVLAQLVGPSTPVPTEELRLLFRDVADHLHLVIDNTESQDRLLSDVLSAHLAQVGVRQNQDMRKISAWVAIAALPTMIAGIYGMNFDRMPELTASFRVGGREVYYGYYVVLGFMLLACLALYLTLRKAGWLGPSPEERERRRGSRRHRGHHERRSSVS